MTKARLAKPTVDIVDKYCQNYRDLFSDVRSYEYFKYLHMGLIAEMPRKTLPAIAKEIGLENEQSLHNFLTESPWAAQDLKERRLKIILEKLGKKEITLLIDVDA